MTDLNEPNSEKERNARDVDFQGRDCALNPWSHGHQHAHREWYGRWRYGNEDSDRRGAA
jgi:hypothetical protein